MTSVETKKLEEVAKEKQQLMNSLKKEIALAKAELKASKKRDEEAPLVVLGRLCKKLLGVKKITIPADELSAEEVELLESSLDEKEMKNLVIQELEEQLEDDFEEIEGGII